MICISKNSMSQNIEIKIPINQSAKRKKNGGRQTQTQDKCKKKTNNLSKSCNLHFGLSKVYINQ